MTCHIRTLCSCCHLLHGWFHCNRRSQRVTQKRTSECPEIKLVALSVWFGAVFKRLSGLNRLRSLPPAAQRRPPRRAAGRSDRGQRSGSNSFFSDHPGTQFGRRHGKLHRRSNSGRHSQRHRRTAVESRIHQSGLHTGRGSSSDWPAAGERGADCVEPGAAGRDFRGRRAGGGSGTMLLPVQMLPERPGSSVLLRPGLPPVCRRDLLCTLFLRPHQAPRLLRSSQPRRLHPLLLRGGGRPRPARYAPDTLTVGNGR